MKAIRAQAMSIPDRRWVVAAYCACGALIGVQDPKYVARVCDTCKAATDAVGRRRRSAASIPPAVRAEVIARDGMRCVYCGCAVRVRSADKYDHGRDTIELDHKTPVFQGGKSTVDNLCVACLACNRRRGNRRPR